MRWSVKQRVVFPVWAGIALPLFVLFGATESAYAQVNSSALPIYYYYSKGASPYSTIVDAQADYLAAWAAFEESISKARINDAEAVKIEIGNVEDYLRMRRRQWDESVEWRKKNNPDFRVNDLRLQQSLKEQIEKNYQEALRGDVTVRLNWLLVELAQPITHHQYIQGGQTLAHSALDQTLTAEDLKYLRLSEGTNPASHLEFGADDEDVLKPHWPLALQSDAFAASRDDYERAVLQIVAEIKQENRVRDKTRVQAIMDINSLLEELKQAYPAKERTGTDVMDYWAAKHFLDASLAATHRAMETCDAHVLSGGLRFHGDSVVQLLQHMYQTGVVFARPEPGGEETNKKLFLCMRMLYMAIGPDKQEAEVQDYLLRAANSAQSGKSG